MPERRGDVPLDEEVAVPGTAVTRDGHEDQEPPVEEQGVDQEQDAQQGAPEMPPPRGRFRVLRHVKGPELIEAPEIHLSTQQYPIRTKEWNLQPAVEIGLWVLFGFVERASTRDSPFGF